MGEDTASGLMFYVGISETPEGVQQQIEEALECTRKWRVTANVKKCAVVVCNEDKVNPVKIQLEVGRR